VQHESYSHCAWFSQQVHKNSNVMLHKDDSQGHHLRDAALLQLLKDALKLD
jgi:hypothetical protein